MSRPVTPVYTRNCEIKTGIEFPDGMQRWALFVEYDGAAFNGFQRQASTPNTVQAVLELALTKVANENISIVCAGRTDAGVHATNQVIHFDTLANRPEKAWVLGCNTQLPDSVRIHQAVPISERFHARFSACKRTYRYLLYSARVRSAHLAKQVTWTQFTLDPALMQQGADHLLGEHDFSAFRAAQCQAQSPVRTVERVVVSQHRQLIVVEVTANAFLHHMVRNLVGSLMEVGRGLRPPEWIAELLHGRDRRLAAPTAAPWGLYLVRVEYPLHFALPEADPGPLILG